MLKFYLHHQKLGDQCLQENNFALAGEYYAQALQLNPFNLLLIAHIAKIIKNTPAARCLSTLLTDAVQNALKAKGERSSVYTLARNISYINRQIIQAHFVHHPLALEQPAVPDLPAQPLTLVLLTCVWQRPELTQIVLSYYQQVRQQLAGQVDLVLLAVGSEGEASCSLCESCGFHYLEHQNLPLSDKWEFGLKNSRQFNPDGIVTIGSDDLISASLFTRYSSLLNQGYLFCGLKDGYFFDLTNPNQLLHWRGYGGLTKERGMPWRLNETIGMGRLYSRTLLDCLDFSLWPNIHINKGLDGAAKERLFSMGMLPVLQRHAVSLVNENNNHSYLFGQVAMEMEELGVSAVDIKSPAGNVTSMMSYTASKDAYQVINSPWLFMERYFPKNTVNALKLLHNSGNYA